MMKRKLVFMTSILMSLGFLAGCGGQNESFTVEWLNYDGTVLEVDKNVAKGTKPEYNGEKPTRPDDAKNHYEFLNWFTVPLPVEKDVKYTAQYRTVSKGNDLDYAGASYAAGKALLEEYVPGGSAIAAGLDVLLGQQEPTLADIKTQLDSIQGSLDSIRDEITKGFQAVENQIAQLAQAQYEMGIAIQNKIDEVGAKIEKVVAEQTVFADKGGSFDELMSSLRIGERQITNIQKDESLSPQTKAVELSKLIGTSDKWTDSGNLYNKYLSFLDSLTGTNFGDLQGRDILTILYDSFYTTDLMFNGEVIYRGSLYASRLNYLALEAYSTCIECLKAAALVSSFSNDDVAQLDTTNYAKYKNGEIASPLSVIQGEIDFLNSKMFEVGFDQVSLADRMNDYYTRDRNVFIYKGEENVRLCEKLLYWKYDSTSDKYEGDFQDALAAYHGFADAKNTLSRRLEDLYAYDDLGYEFKFPEVFVEYVKQLYADLTFADILKMLGYDISDLTEDTLFVTGFHDDRNNNKIYADGIKLNAAKYESSSVELLEYYYEQNAQHDDGNMKLMWNRDISMVLLHLD